MKSSNVDAFNKSEEGGICRNVGLDKHIMCRKGLVCCKPDGSELTSDGNTLAGLCIRPPPNSKKQCQYDTGIIAGQKKGQKRYPWNINDTLGPRIKEKINFQKLYKKI